MKFQIFFFKENTRSLDTPALVDFLLEDENMSLVTTDDQVSINYSNSLVGLDYSLIFTKTSRVPDIARLSPKYLDLDFFVEYDMLLPLFKVNMISSVIEKICSRFNLLIYNYLFEDVTSFTRDIIKTGYDRARRLYKEKYPSEYQGLVFVTKSKLDAYYKYVLDAKATNEYYNNKYLFLDAYFGLNVEKGEMCLISNFRLDCSLIIPPSVDVIELELNGNKFYYDFKEVEVLIKKYIKEFPGFVGNTKMIDENHIKKVKKILSKMKVKPIMERISLVEQERLIDF
ncbi:MAG: hypothetical protein R3Y60_05230 [bacterium]